jgi:hypothetical protein
MRRGSGAQPARRANAASLVIRPAMRPGDQYLCGRERTGAGLLEQLRRQLPRERLDLACELALLDVRCLDAPGESAERQQRPAQLRVLAASGRTAASLRRSCARVSERSSARSGSGADTSKPRNWRSPARLAVTAPSRAALSARNASRNSPVRATHRPRTAGSGPRSFTIEHVFESLPSPNAGLSLLETLNEEQAAAGGSVTIRGSPSTTSVSLTALPEPARGGSRGAVWSLPDQGS